ncbi:phage baseplate assembly protein V [Comamonas antarctica]|uniref:Phage baseplate assembly protein V n=1 Tax=Comamonas antarctica TaxID=2743470 RepID=A0A6N1X067_9BURK|nr:phage baseplate assembly protein V [Comamonas antarctica]QKV52647.1 phage baseplate assembly protein V [Comamonas antarctica]
MSTPDPILALSELQRLVHNLIRVGSIHEVDHGGPGQPARVRVQIGELVTNWRPYHECRAGGTKTWNPPTVGEQATVLSPSGDLGAAVVLVGLNSTGNPAPSNDPNKTVSQYPDGTVVEYDHASHALLVTLVAGGAATLAAPGSVTVDSPEVTMTGNCTVDGTLTYKGGMRGSGKAAGATSSAEIDGTMRASEDVVAGGVSLRNHTHPGVLQGGSNTQPPGGAA